MRLIDVVLSTKKGSSRVKPMVRNFEILCILSIYGLDRGMLLDCWASVEFIHVLFPWTGSGSKPTNDRDPGGSPACRRIQYAKSLDVSEVTTYNSLKNGRGTRML